MGELLLISPKRGTLAWARKPVPTTVLACNSQAFANHNTFIHNPSNRNNTQAYQIRKKHTKTSRYEENTKTLASLTLSRAIVFKQAEWYHNSKNELRN